MSFPSFEDENSELALASQREALTAMGARPDEPFLVLTEATKPLEETVFCCGVPPRVLFNAQDRQTGVNLAAIQVGNVTLVRYEVVLYDDPVRPWSISCMANPHAEQMRSMLSALAEQDTIQILFYDETGVPLKRRIFSHDPDMRASLRDIVARVEGITITNDEWVAALTAAEQAGI